MERTNNGEFEDYWNEFRQSESTTQNDDSKDISSTFEEGETEVDWLRDAGFGFEFLVQEELAGQDEDSILEKELATLTHHQAETVKKRFLTWKNTFRRKRNHDRLPHVRDVFGQLKHGKEVIHVENFSSSLFSNERSEDRLPEVEHSLAYYRAPNNNDLFAEIQNKHSKSQRKEKEFRRSSHKEYKLRSCNDSNSDIEILRYQICGTMKHHSNQQLRTNYSENDKSPAITLCTQVDATTPQTVDFRVKEKVFTEHQNSEELPEVEQIHEKYGLTYPADLGKGDLIKIQRLALIELTTLFDSLGLTYTRKKPIKIKTKENMVFGVPLTTLLEYDCKMYTHCRVPLVFQKILFSLENQGLTEVGLLRVGSSRQKVEVLKKEIEAYFYTSPDIVDNILYSCSPHEVASLLKHFIRSLPEPLLTNKYMNAFLQIQHVQETVKQLQTLNLLVILLPEAHQQTLLALVTFLARLAADEDKIKMSLRNIAMIIAPNLFPPTPKGDLQSELHMARITCRVTEMLIKYRDILWTIPVCLLKQVRKNNEYKALKKADHKLKKKLRKKLGVDFYDIIGQEQSNVSKVEIELKPQQFDSRPFSVCIDNNTRVGDVIYKAAYHLDVISYSQEIPNNDDYSHRTMYDVLNGFNPTQYCLQTNTDAATFVKTHSLHEVGGNFGERRLRNEAFVLAIHVENPTAGWELRCNHL